MACFHPLTAYRSVDEKTTSGKSKIIFNNFGTSTLAEIKLPCGQCVGCRLERSRQWATRCHHEASLYSQNCFITLTYDDKNLPWDHSLVKSHFQLFMKRLRKLLEPKTIRFYHAGEYGNATPENDFIARPHYHAIIFNHQFADRELFLEREGIQLCTSKTLDRVWNKGFASVGDMTFQSAAYVARYIMKKINGEQADEHYTRTDFTTGEILHVLPEYSTMSRNSGIGKKWFDKYQSDCYPADSLHVRGVKQKPPKYYDYLYDLDPIGDLELIKQNRKKAASKHLKDNTPDRLASREIVKKAQLNQLNRTL